MALSKEEKKVQEWSMRTGKNLIDVDVAVAGLDVSNDFEVYKSL